MSYAKIQQACQDYALGFQTINQARDNIIALYDAWKVQHNDGDENPALKHWTRLVPKAQGVVSVSTTFYPGITVYSTFAVGVTVVRVSTGMYVANVLGVAGPVWADADPIAANGTPVRRINSRSQASSVSSGVLLFNLFELTAGDFALTDYSFSFVVHGGP